MHHLRLRSDKVLARVLLDQSRGGPISGALLVRLASTTSKLDEMVPITVDFPARHIGPRKHDARAMLKQLGYTSLDELTDAAVPDDIKLNRDLRLDEPLSEFELIKRVKSIGDRNKVSFIENIITILSMIVSVVENLHWYGLLRYLYPSHNPEEHV